MGDIKKRIERWEESIKESKQKDALNPRNTTSGIPVKLLYTPLDTKDIDVEKEIGVPGEYPFTRGVQKTMYRGRLWTMRQYAGFGDAEESNKRYHYLLNNGQTGLSIAFDLPTQMGYDSDDPMSAGEVGKVGVAIDSLEDMEILFKGIPLDKVSTSMTINATASLLLAMYIVVGEKQGVAPEKLSGTIQNDILKEYVARGTFIYPPEPSMRIITDIFAYCKDNLPKFNTISVSGYHIREAGSSAVQEVAFTLADGIAYVEAAIKAGLEVDAFARRISFFFNVHNNFIEEIAKFRAARRLWAKIMKERFKAKEDRSCMLRFHTQTAGCTLTAQQPQTNIIRVTIQALAAVLGGTQSLHTNSMDEALALPTEDAVRIALRTQQIIAYESGVADTVDPVGGSYAIESLTNEIERRAQEYIDKIDSMGGMMKAIEAGYIQKEIQDSAYAYQKMVESKEQIVVGVNEFTIEEEPIEDILKVDPAIEKKQKEKLAALRNRRDNKKCAESLAKVEETAKGSGNLMPAIIDAVRDYNTLGEIAGTLKKVFGEHKETVIL
ncbi:MAG: methylmalonyl-CoA mutase [Candidatus Schekmanbacteria bacterium]|nr:MAG: methylmalonyl-CoA mutase [Candidatus Schekmanbacteria bacterium]